MKAARISRQGTVRTDYAVAGNQDPNRVLCICRGDSAYCPGVAELSREFCIGKGISERNFRQSLPNLLLKRSPFWQQGYVKIFETPLKVGVQLSADLDKGGRDTLTMRYCVSNGEL